MRFGVREIAKEKFYAARKPMKFWDVNVYNIVISKLVETKTNSRYLIGYSDKAVRQLILIMSKMSGYVKAFKVKDGHKDKFFCIDDEKLLEKYKAIWIKIKNLKKY